jgi:hypothetical protein
MSRKELVALAREVGLPDRTKLIKQKNAASVLRPALIAHFTGTPAPVSAPVSVPAVRTRGPQRGLGYELTDEEFRILRESGTEEEPALGAIRASTGAEPVTGSLLAPLDASLSFGNFIAGLVDD